MKIVLDASMALAWIFERQSKSEAQSAEDLLNVFAESEVLVPMLWHTEIANALLIGERRKVITEAQVIVYLNRLSMLPIITDDVMPDIRREQVMALAREYELTAYDATYLELALRHNAKLASFDTKLKKAMQQTGGNIFNQELTP